MLFWLYSIIYWNDQLFFLSFLQISQFFQSFVTHDAAVFAVSFFVSVLTLCGVLGSSKLVVAVVASTFSVERAVSVNASVSILEIVSNWPFSIISILPVFSLVFSRFFNLFRIDFKIKYRKIVTYLNFVWIEWILHLRRDVWIPLLILYFWITISDVFSYDVLMFKFILII